MQVVRLASIFYLKKKDQVSKGECEVYYEIYIDSLFLVNFVMNLYLLGMVNIVHGREAMNLRLVLGALFAAVMYCIIFLMTEIPTVVRMPLGVTITLTGMIFISFPIKGIKAFFHVIRNLLTYSFLMGGVILFILKRVPIIAKWKESICLVLGMGAFGYLFYTYIKKRTKEERYELKKVMLKSKEKEMEVMGFFDTGNGLMEPISKKPVSIMSKTKLEELFGENLPLLYRVVPYKSIGKPKGILYCYEVLELKVDVMNMERCIKNVFIAYSEEYESANPCCQIILNPGLINEEE